MTRAIVGALCGAFLLTGACGGGDTGPDTDAPVMSKASPSGDAQSAPVGTTLPLPLRVVVSQAGSPVSGRTVTWAVLASSGSVNPASSVTGSDGVATTSVTLPTFAATSVVSAASSGVTGSPLRFNLTSTGAGLAVTVQVVNNEFQPDNFELKAGGTVTFVWGSGSGPHNVAPVAPNSIPASEDLPTTKNAPYSFSVTFPATGTFDFHCQVHGAPTSGMRGRVTVVP